MVHKNSPAPAPHPSNLATQHGVLRTHVSIASHGIEQMLGDIWGKGDGANKCETENILEFRLSRIASKIGICPGAAPCLQVLLEVPSPPSLTRVYKTS